MSRHCSEKMRKERVQDVCGWKVGRSVLDKNMELNIYFKQSILDSIFCHLDVKNAAVAHQCELSTTKPSVINITAIILVYHRFVFKVDL